MEPYVPEEEAVTMIEFPKQEPLSEGGDEKELAPEPCVAFLFLTRGDAHHLEIWKELGHFHDQGMCLNRADATLVTGKDWMASWIERFVPFDSPRWHFP